MIKSRDIAILQMQHDQEALAKTNLKYLEMLTNAQKETTEATKLNEELRQEIANIQAHIE